jgi:hypothetical protein
MYECDKNQMPYYNSKDQIFRNFGPLIEHGPHWINFTILTFISEKKKTLKAYIKFGTKLIRLT